MQYRGSSQHDAQEFLLWLLDRVHEDLNNLVKNNGSPPVRVRPLSAGHGAWVCVRSSGLATCGTTQGLDLGRSPWGWR